MTDVSALMKRLIAAGCDPVEAGAVLAEAVMVGAASVPFRAKTGAERQVNYKARKQVTKGDESDENVTSVTQCSILNKSLNKEEDKKERKIESASKRGTRLPADWQPSPTDLSAAADEGMPGDVAAHEAAKFKDYWIAKPGASATKLDWPATWRNWVRRVCEQRGFSPGTGPPGKPKLPEAEIIRLRERYEQKQRERL